MRMAGMAPAARDRVVMRYSYYDENKDAQYKKRPAGKKKSGFCVGFRSMNESVWCGCGKFASISGADWQTPSFMTLQLPPIFCVMMGISSVARFGHDRRTDGASLAPIRLDLCRSILAAQMSCVSPSLSHTSSLL